jgi:hypothetical protein
MGKKIIFYLIKERYYFRPYFEYFKLNEGLSSLRLRKLPFPKHRGY